MKNHHTNKVFAAAAAALLLAAPVLSDEVTLEEAKCAVGNWISQGGLARQAIGAEVSGETLDDPQTGARMHLVRVPGHGFVVTSADDGIEPIILFSDDGGSGPVPEEGNPLWDLLRWDISARARALAEFDDAGASQPKKSANVAVGDGAAVAMPTPKEKWAALLPAKRTSQIPKTTANQVGYASVWHERCRPLLRTSWNQTEGAYGSIFNLYTPEITEVVNAPRTAAAAVPDGSVCDALVTNTLGRCPVGCVAVAAGQLMKYWEWPKSAIKEKDVKCTVDGKEQMLHFYGTQVLNGTRLANYSWRFLDGSEPGRELGSEFVSRLLSDIGVTCHADYKIGATSMSLYTLTSELKNTFGYLNAVYHTGNLSGSGLREVVIPNLDAGCPVLMGIGHAHAVVADGYGFDRTESTFYLHINLGWGYRTHYWYAPPNIDRYSTIDEIVCNVFPDRRGQILSGRVVGPKGRAIYNATVLYDGTIVGSEQTNTRGIYHTWVSAGTYRVWAQDAYGTASSPVSVTVADMTTSVNGNRIVNIRHTSARTVGDIAMAVPSVESAKGATDSTISSPVSVTLSCPTAGAKIYYTVDGSIPTPDSAVYSGPITIQDTTTLQAVAFADGMECSETFEKTWTFVDTVSRDDFANARPLSGTSGSTSFCNLGYTKESGEPTHDVEYGYGGASAWASWVAPADGDWTFYLSGTMSNNGSLNTLLAVYTGDSVGRLTRIAVNDNVNAAESDYSSRLSFRAKAGVTYRIAMDTKYAWYSDDYCGNLTLRWEEGFVHYANLAYSTMFAPVSGCTTKIDVSSSGRWNVVECSDWITPDAVSGDDGSSLVFSVAANSTGSERFGFITIQSGNSELSSLSVRQGVVDFVVTRDEAEDAAWRKNKRILLVRGRELCGNTTSVMFYSIPSATVKSALDAGYVLWYSNCDRQYDAPGYSSGLGSYTLPLICILDPLDMSKPVARLTGYQSADSLKSFLNSNASWSGLPSGKITVTYNPGANGSEPQQAVTRGQNVAFTLKGAIFTRNGYMQTGWAKSDGGVKAYELSASYTGNASVSFYPVWTPRAFTVTLDRQNGLSSIDVTATYGSDMPEISVPKRSGYTFGGYYTGLDGSGTQYYKSSGVGARKWTLLHNITLYAKWTKDPSFGTPKFSVDKGVLTHADPNGAVDVVIPDGVTSIGGVAFDECYGLHSVTIPESVTSIEAYSFYNCGDLISVRMPRRFEGNLNSSVFYGCPSGLVITYYDPYYTVRFHRNDASDEKTAAYDFDYGVATRIPSLNSLGWARRGIDFLGWATSRANADAGKVWKKDWASISTAAAAGKTLDVYAVWALKSDSYAIEFVRNDGAGTWRTIGFKYGEKTRMPSLANGLKWARRGYEFKGWALTTADAAAGKVWKGDWAYVSTPVKVGEVLTAYAVWALKPGYYQIRYNKNDGTGKWRALGYEYGVSTKLPTVKALGWTVSGKKFKGWATSAANASAGKVWKTDGAAVSTAAAEGKTLSIYAIWQ